MPTYRERFLAWVIHRLSVLGQPDLALWVFGLIRSLYRDDPERYFRFLRNRARESHWFEPFFAAHEVGHVASEVGDEALDLLDELSGHENDLVREAAARSWSRVLEEDFERGFQRIRVLSRRSEYSCRRTAALAPVLFYEQSATEEQRRRLRSFWEEFLDDPRSGLRNLVQSQILDRFDVT